MHLFDGISETQELEQNLEFQARTLCPSGLRGWTQVPLAQAAWVQIPQLSQLSRCLCPPCVVHLRREHPPAVFTALLFQRHETSRQLRQWGCLCPHVHDTHLVCSQDKAKLLLCRDSLPEWSKGVDSSSTSASCVGSNPTAVICYYPRKFIL